MCPPESVDPNSVENPDGGVIVFPAPSMPTHNRIRSPSSSVGAVTGRVVSLPVVFENVESRGASSSVTTSSTVSGVTLAIWAFACKLLATASATVSGVVDTEAAVAAKLLATAKSMAGVVDTTAALAAKLRVTPGAAIHTVNASQSSEALNPTPADPAAPDSCSIYCAESATEEA